MQEMCTVVTQTYQHVFSKMLTARNLCLSNMLVGLCYHCTHLLHEATLQLSVLPSKLTYQPPVKTKVEIYTWQCFKVITGSKMVAG